MSPILERCRLHTRCMARKRRLSWFHVAGILRELETLGGALILLATMGAIYLSAYILASALQNCVR